MLHTHYISNRLATMVINYTIFNGCKRNVNMGHISYLKSLNRMTPGKLLVCLMQFNIIFNVTLSISTLKWKYISSFLVLLQNNAKFNFINQILCTKSLRSVVTMLNLNIIPEQFLDFVKLKKKHSVMFIIFELSHTFLYNVYVFFLLYVHRKFKQGI